MKHLKILFFIGLSAICFGQDQFKIGVVAFYNFENLFDTIDTPDVKDTEFSPKGEKLWNSERYFKKVGNMAKVISELGIDKTPNGVSILGVSEIENESVLIDVINHPLLKERNYQVFHKDSPDARGIDVAMIYDQDVFTVKHHKMLPLEKYTKEQKRTTRDIMMVTGDLDGEEIHVFINHWPSRGGGEKKTSTYRQEAAQICANTIDSLRQINPNAKAIVMGDLNDNPTDKSVKGNLRSKDNIKKVGHKDMYNPMISLFKKGDGSNAWRDTWSLFDQIILSKGFLDKNQDGFFYYQTEIFKPKYMQQSSGKYKGYPKRSFSGSEFTEGYSDHYPVCIYLLKKI